MAAAGASALLFGGGGGGGGIGGGGGGGDVVVDEQVAAQAALDAAEERLQSLCAAHAGTFVGVERRWRSTQSNLGDLLAKISSAQEQVKVAARALDPEGEAGEEKESDDARFDGTSVAPASSSSSSSSSSLAYLAEQHRLRRRTLLQHSSLLELLELASLMDACVRSSLYEEALAIAAFANTLERRHGGAVVNPPAGGGGGQDSGTSGSTSSSNSVVTRVVQQIRGRQEDLRRHLLDRLKSNVTMPVCLEVVTALRRLNSIDLESNSSPPSASASLERIHAAMEFTLQVEFLEARDSWLDSSASSAPTSGLSMTTSASARASLGPMQPSEQLLDAIERYRTRVFEVATQFNAIFRAQTPSESSVPSLSLLSMWLGRRIHAFLTLLMAQLQMMEDSAALRDALEASVFFATSMGRLGADFTPRLGPIFEPRMLAIVAKQWKDGSALLAETLATCRNAQVNFPLVAVTSSGAAPEGSGGAAAPAFAAADGEGGVMAPPRHLLSFPPLARFVNAILTGLNELRRCLLPGIFSRLISELEQVVTATRLELVAHERAVLVPGFRGEAAALRETAARYLQVWDEMVVPYVRGSLRAALGQVDHAESFYESLREKTPPEPSTSTSDVGPATSDIDPPRLLDEVNAEEASGSKDDEAHLEDE